DNLIAYANDAYCALGGGSRADLIGSPFAPAVLEQGETVLQDDGTRVHDQKIATAAGPRWIAWREVVVRSGAHTEVQSVGRDVTGRVEADADLPVRRTQPKAATPAKPRSLPLTPPGIRPP